MTLVLQPQNSFTIVHQIPNHLDTATYYIQAVIRNAYTDAVIDTLQLTDKGSQRFKKDWAVPADPSGQGFYISVITSVYTDSGYTSKSPNYGDDENTYLIQERIRLNGLGGSGGADVFDIRRIIGEELTKFRQTLDADEAKEAENVGLEEPEPPMRWEEVLSAIANLRVFIEQNEQREEKDADYSQILEKISTTEQSIIEQIKRSEAEDVDFDPLKTEVQNLSFTLKQKIDTATNELKTAIESNELGVKLTQLRKLLSDPEIQALLAPEPADEPEEERPRDIANLSS